ncbi:hypothetical protein [Cupriavidus sp. UYPR2.512]|uniref:hypothetical protein n=1 Tax=Cupriavidus sp. UYPR2.512 TaxID=1080187 RepID=UPI00036AC4A5|nr:hypothetical protein [Cupriavidus sp. UYPR2.512]UIF90917.1 hypothetical protein KAF44_32545 [Cupriavidus necator]
MIQSIAQQRGRVPFPAHIGERVYMREFRKADGLPADLSRWQSTVDAMLDGVDTDGPIYLMVDQGAVRAGNPHRRPGLHIDGYWNPGVHAHGPHRPDTPHHSVRPPRHIHSSGGDHGFKWTTSREGVHWPSEAIILASDVSACRAMVGEFEGMPAEGGDCSHIDVAGMEEIRFHAGHAYAGNVTMLHESLPVAVDCLRTVVRLNVPGWSPTA